MAYPKTAWVNDAPPRINAANLNKIEEGIEAAHIAIQQILDGGGGGGGGGGVTDHGALSGLGDDDHPQYLTQSRGDARYVRPSSLPAVPTWDTLSGKPAVIAAGTTQAAARTAIGAGTSNLAIGTTGVTAAAGNHTHPVTDLTATGTRSDTTFLRGDGTWATPPAGGGGGVSDHGALAGLADDDHPQYLNATRGDARYVQDGDARLTNQRVPTDASVTNAKVAVAAAISLDKTADSSTRLAMTDAERTKLTGVAAGATVNSTDAQLRERASHTGVQAISTITGLQTALDDKAATTHTHTTAQVTGLDAALAGKVSGTGITEIQAMTQAQYDALATKVVSTLYVITD